MDGNANHTGHESERVPKQMALQFLYHLQPVWFTVCMGTGVLGSALYSLPYEFDGKTTISLVFFFMALVLFCLLLAAFALRSILYPYLVRELTSPSGIQHLVYLGTIPIALGSLVNGIAIIIYPHTGPWAATAAWTMWWVQVGLSVVAFSILPYALLGRGHFELSDVIGSWLLLFIPALVAANAGSAVASIVSANRALIAIYLSYVLLGGGGSLCCMLMTIFFYRLLVCELPSSGVIASAFIVVSPLAQATYAVVMLGKGLVTTTSVSGYSTGGIDAHSIASSSLIAALLIWGAALWWTVLDLTLVLSRLRHRLLITPQFWGAVFPLGSLAAATALLAKNLPSRFFAVVAALLLACTAIIWVLLICWTLYSACWNRTKLKA